jgi:hypothetical protein
VPPGWEAEANEALAGIRLHGFQLDTRRRRRVSTQIRRLAWVFVIAFAREPNRLAGGIRVRVPFDSTAYGCERRCNEAVIYARLRGLLIVGRTNKTKNTDHLNEELIASGC